MKNFKLLFFNVVISTLITSTITYKVGYIKGWSKGSDDIFKVTTDTVIAICNKQAKSDTTVTKLIIVNPDTNIFYLSRKTLFLKK